MCFAKVVGAKARTYSGLILGAVPAAVVGLGFKDTIESLAAALGIMLCVTAVVLFLSQRAKVARPWASAPLASALRSVRHLPGISRSSTIGAALVLGVPREEAALSFLMALVPIGGATLLTLKEVLEQPTWRKPEVGLGRDMPSAPLPLLPVAGCMRIFVGEAQQFGRIWRLLLGRGHPVVHFG